MAAKSLISLAVGVSALCCWLVRSWTTRCIVLLCNFEDLLEYFVLLLSQFLSSVFKSGSRCSDVRSVVLNFFNVRVHFLLLLLHALLYFYKNGVPADTRFAIV